MYTCRGTLCIHVCTELLPSELQPSPLAVGSLPNRYNVHVVSWESAYSITCNTHISPFDHYHLQVWQDCLVPLPPIVHMKTWMGHTCTLNLEVSRSADEPVPELYSTTGGEEAALVPKTALTRHKRDKCDGSHQWQFVSLTYNEAWILAAVFLIYIFESIFFIFVWQCCQVFSYPLSLSSFEI